MTDTSGSPAAGGNLIDTDYQIGKDNLVTHLGPFEVDIHNPVFAISGLMTVVFVIFTLAFPEFATGMFTTAMNWVTVRFDWLFILASNIFLVFAVAIALSPYGKVRLGGADSKPTSRYWHGFPCCLRRAWASGSCSGASVNQ